jgi:hypothetical protein
MPQVLTTKQINALNKKYCRDEVWTIYTVKDGEKNIVGYFTGVHPYRCKLWKQLDNELDKYDRIGYCRNEDYHAIIP